MTCNIKFAIEIISELIAMSPFSNKSRDKKVFDPR